MPTPIVLDTDYARIDKCRRLVERKGSMLPFPIPAGQTINEALADFLEKEAGKTHIHSPFRDGLHYAARKVRIGEWDAALHSLRMFCMTDLVETADGN